jgi:hypothetical protein
MYKRQTAVKFAFNLIRMQHNIHTLTLILFSWVYTGINEL